MPQKSKKPQAKPKSQSAPEVKTTQKETSSKKDDKIIFAFLATFLSIIGFVIAIVAKREDKYVMYYAKHSLVIFIIGAVASVLGTIFSILPIIGTIIRAALGLLIFIIWLISWIYALSGEEKEIPVITDFAKKFDF